MRSFWESGSDDRLGALRRLTERGLADALIIADTEGVEPRVDYLLKLAKPFVTFGRTRTSARHAWVDADFEAAVEGAIERLVMLGHRRIGLVLPDLRRNYLDLVETGYRRGMWMRGLRIDDRWYVRRPTGERGGLNAADALLGRIPDQLRFSFRELMHAVALYRRLAEAGLRPGQDISILSLLPDAHAQYLLPTLTTYQTNWTEIGKMLADAVTSEIVTAGADRQPEEGSVPKLLRPRVQYKMPVEFSPGESVHRVEASS